VIPKEATMDKSKKKIIAGVGLLGGAGLVYLLTRKKAVAAQICTPGDTKCIGADLCVCNTQGTKWDVSVPNSPTCVVTPGTAVLYGSVTDTETRKAIEGIQVSCGSYSGTTEADGQYRIENIPPGDYTVTFTDPTGKYQTKEV
jgi:hypothetical protein